MSRHASFRGEVAAASLKPRDKRDPSRESFPLQSTATTRWGVLRLKDANIGSVVFKKAKVFNSIKVSHRVPADTAITAP